MAAKLDFGLHLCQPVEACRCCSRCTFFTSMPEVPSKTCRILAWSVSTRCHMYLNDGTIAWFFVLAQLSHLFSSMLIPRASSTCPDRSVPSGSVSDTISLNLGNLTWGCRQLNALWLCSFTRRTLSRMTSGPLMPPIVLYRIRGCTLIRASSIEGAMLVRYGKCVERTSSGTLGKVVRQSSNW